MRRLQKIGVSHPNIVSVNEVFEANNTAYYVMEYIDGESLRSYVQRNGPLGEAGLRRLLLPVMDAVEALHAERLTHLDIKPDNIMLARRKDGSIRPVLIDFGLAKHYGADGTPTSTVNTLGCSAGYSPMEQYMGIRTFSPTADVYALGATMLYCLTGETPCVANEITSDDISGAIPAGVSEALRHTISEAMEASARARTQSVRAMVGNLGGEMPEPAAGAVNVGSGGGNASGGKETVVIAGGGSGSVRQGRPRRRVYAVAGVMAALVAVAVIMMLAFRGSVDGLSVGIDDTAVVAEEGIAAIAHTDTLPASQALKPVQEQPEKPQAQDQQQQAVSTQPAQTPVSAPSSQEPKPLAQQKPNSDAQAQPQAPVPVAQEQQPKPQEFDWRSLSRLENLALACERDGVYFYFSRPNWERIPVSEKSRFSKKGVVVIGNGERFILALHDNGQKITWDEAKAQYGERLPTKSQAEAMASNHKAINAAIIAFGGDSDPQKIYWTRTEYSSSSVWYVGMNSGGFVHLSGKSCTTRVRAVTPLPVSSAI